MEMISVLMASYNYQVYMEEAIKSILGQTWKNFELFIIDDGSKDNSIELAHSLAKQDSRIHVLQHYDGKNHGLPETLLRGLNEAQGEWIAFLESDDFWEPTCLEQRMKVVQQTGADVVFNAIRPFPMPGADTGWFNTYVPRVMREHAHRSLQAEGAYSLQTSLLVENKIPTFSCAMLRAECLRKCSFTAPVPRWLDWWIWIQVAQEHLFAFVPDELTLWRLHAGSYNHKIAFGHYIQDNMRLWNGFKQLQNFYKKSGKTYGYWFLLGPFWVRLRARFGMIAYQSGILGTLKQIRNRIR